MKNINRFKWQLRETHPKVRPISYKKLENSLNKNDMIWWNSLPEETKRYVYLEYYSSVPSFKKSNEFFKWHNKRISRLKGIYKADIDRYRNNLIDEIIK